MSLALLQAGLSALSVDVLKATQSAEQAAGAFAAAAKVIPRRDQSVGMNAIDRKAAEIYRLIFSATPGLKLPGYGITHDLITIAPYLRRRP